MCDPIGSVKYSHDLEPLPINDQHRSRGHPYWPLYPHEWIFEWTSSWGELFLLLHDISQTPEVRFIASPWANTLSTMQVTSLPVLFSFLVFVFRHPSDQITMCLARRWWMPLHREGPSISLHRRRSKSQSWAIKLLDILFLEPVSRRNSHPFTDDV